ncbi:MAG TPA: hypothetical protein PKM88_02630, partial [bacterium]|nr:hypothetical protein [bacterium]
LDEKLIRHWPRPLSDLKNRVQCLNTVIGKMSGIVADEGEIVRQDLARMVGDAGRCFLVEAFNRILITRVQWPDFRRGIEVFELIAKQGALTPAQQALLAAYGEGMDCYLNRRWEQGIAAFSEALRLVPEDGPSRLYVDRCRAYKDTPPPDDWNGIFVMKTK